MFKQKTIENKVITREIISFALPVFGQVIVSPIMITADTAIVGHLLTTGDLAALTVGSAVCGAILGIFVFMIFVTNATVARAFGAGKIKRGLRFGMNSIWLGIALGLAISVALYLLAPTIVSLFGADTVVTEGAVAYIRGMCFGFPGNLVIMAATGVLRGIKRFKLPMIVAVSGVVVNIPLNILFLTVFKMGIFGSGLATSLTFLLSAAVLFIRVIYESNRHKSKKRPSMSGMKESAIEGLPIFLRTLALWTAILIFMVFISSFDNEVVAGFQIADSILSFMIMTVDSIAEAINSMIATELGANNKKRAKTILSCAIRLGLKVAAILSIMLLLTSFFIPALYTPDEQVHKYAFWALIETALIFTYAAFAFITDGALIAVKDTKFLAASTTISMFIYVTIALILEPFLPKDLLGFLVLFFTYDGIFLGLRVLFAYWRLRGDRWLKNT